jgi:hypothetical protein
MVPEGPGRTIAGTEASARWMRRVAAELAVLAAIGLLMGALGPYDTTSRPTELRFAYWLLAILGGGAIGIGIDRLLERRVAGVWPRVILVSLAMTPVVTVFILALNRVMFGLREPLLPAYLHLLWQVFAISLPLMAVRALVWRRADPVIETRVVVELPLPEHEIAFRRRLSAKRRTARLIAIEAHDHYLRVHTDAGAELVTLRFADAMAELERAHGYRLHRSWWVAADAIEVVRWHRGGGTARLSGGLEVPVSRRNVQPLKDAGWF